MLHKMKFYVTYGLQETILLVKIKFYVQAASRSYPTDHKNLDGYWVVYFKSTVSSLASTFGQPLTLLFVDWFWIYMYK